MLRVSGIRVLDFVAFPAPKFGMVIPPADATDVSICASCTMFASVEFVARLFEGKRLVVDVLPKPKGLIVPLI